MDKLINKEDQVEEILDYFDFEKVAKVMEALDWKWWSIGEVPGTGPLRRQARRLLREVATLPPGTWTSTGGLKAHHDKWGQLELEFIVAGWRVEPKEE
jgi:hypothetical protein